MSPYPLFESMAPANRTPTTRPRLERKLVTRHYEATIADNSPEGTVESDEVTYRGLSKRSGRSITLKGSTYHTHGKDGSPSRFLGYVFHNGNVTYTVLDTESADKGRLLIVRGDNEVLVDEVGTLQDVK